MNIVISLLIYRKIKCINLDFKFNLDIQTHTDKDKDRGYIGHGSMNQIRNNMNSSINARDNME